MRNRCEKLIKKGNGGRQEDVEGVHKIKNRVYVRFYGNSIHTERLSMDFKCQADQKRILAESRCVCMCPHAFDPIL